MFTISSYAPYLESSEEDRTAEVSRARALEDEAFDECLLRNTGAPHENLTWVDWQQKDLPLRWQVDAAVTLGNEALRDAEIKDLVNLMRSLPEGALYLSPAAIGGHIDHRLVRAAATQALPEECLLFYQDLPYACRVVVSDAGTTQQEWFGGMQTLVDRKREYALCYPSQIKEEVADEMEAYARAHDGCEAFSGSAVALHCLQQLLTETFA